MPWRKVTTPSQTHTGFVSKKILSHMRTLPTSPSGVWIREACSFQHTRVLILFIYTQAPHLFDSTKPRMLYVILYVAIQMQRLTKMLARISLCINTCTGISQCSDSYRLGYSQSVPNCIVEKTSIASGEKIVVLFYNYIHVANIGF